jgi:anaerobic magnesium-protoporphyrin IX monomethyl ester cyclase
MKILFTNSPLHFSHGHTFTQPDWQTLILPYLAGIAGEKHTIRLVDNMHYSFWKSNHTLEEIADFNPDIVGFSIIASRDIFKTIGVIEMVRKSYPNLKIIAGGQAGTYYHEWLLKSGVDFVVHKEAEVTLDRLIEGIENGLIDFSDIDGLSYVIDGQIYKTKNRKMIKNLDDTPFPRYDLMPKIKSKWFPKRFTGSVEMSRGCPYNCNFCAISSFWERSFRQKSNERIIEELKILKSQGRTHVYLADDNFAMNPKKNIELFEMMLNQNLDVKIFAQIRADTVAKNPKMIELASKAGLYGVLVGFDTYDPNTFNDVTKTTSRDLNIECSKTLRKNKIAIFGTHIYGLPNQKEPKDFEITFQMGRKYSDLFRMPHFSPLPFTKGYESYVRINPSQNLSIEERYKRDFRPRVGDEEQQKKMGRGYNYYTWRHNLSLSEIIGALFHPNPVVRKFKRMSYVATTRHYFYRILRKFNLIDI